MILNASLSLVLVLHTDSYTTEDIVFEWNATDVSVGTEEMAQFEYKGAKLSSDEDVFTTGNKCFFSYTQFSSQLPTPTPLPFHSSSPPVLSPPILTFIYLRSIFSTLFFHYDHKQHAST